MKTLLVKGITPILVFSGLVAVGFMAVVKMIEDRYEENYFYE